MPIDQSNPTETSTRLPLRESPIAEVRGTRDWLPEDLGALEWIEHTLRSRFESVGYRPMRTSILEPTELHQRKSGAGIISKLFELADGRPHRLCLRPELTASIVRSFTAAEAAPAIPWRVASSGPVFRFEREPGPGRYREFTQSGVELLGEPGVEGDAEIITLAVDAAKAVGLDQLQLRIGHTGMILELLDRSGLPTVAVAAMVEHLSDKATEGRGVRALETALDRLSGWLQSPSEQDAKSILPAVEQADDTGVERLFRHLVPRVIGRRTGSEIIHRLRRKWNLGHSLDVSLDRVRDRLRALSDLRGPANTVLEPLLDQFGELAPTSIRTMYDLVGLLDQHGIDRSRVELDPGFGHGIGFYSKMIFELGAQTPKGPIAVCHGGRYDGLATVLGSDRDPHGVGFAFGIERIWHALQDRESLNTAGPNVGSD